LLASFASPCAAACGSLRTTTRCASSRLPQACLSLTWLVSNLQRKEGRTTIGYKLNYLLACFMVLAGLFILVAGFYASVISIKDAFSSGEVGSPFSCVDNSGSTVVQI
jgi:hypothetical protein